MVGFKFKVGTTATDMTGLTTFDDITLADPNIKKCIEIEPTSEPISVDLSTVDEYRTGESKVESD